MGSKERGYARIPFRMSLRACAASDSGGIVEACDEDDDEVDEDAALVGAGRLEFATGLALSSCLEKSCWVIAFAWLALGKECC